MHHDTHHNKWQAHWIVQASEQSAWVPEEPPPTANDSDGQGTDWDDWRDYAWLATRHWQ